MTDAERNAAWDDQFYGSLGEFDKRLSKEQADIEKQRSAAAGSGHSGSNASGDGSGSGGASGTPQEVSGGDAGAAGSSTSGPSGGAGQPSSGPKYPAPDGTPTGVDDDVVARQLREAAESEKDPELRERLWQEYRKYKARK